jgi:hypothetical protein
MNLVTTVTSMTAASFKHVQNANSLGKVQAAVSISIQLPKRLSHRRLANVTETHLSRSEHKILHFFLLKSGKISMFKNIICDI